MAVKTHLSAEDFDQILQQYALGTLDSTQSMKSGTVQSNFLIQTTAGRFVLKVYESRAIKSVRFEANLVAYLCNHHFPCAGILRNWHGQFVGICQEKPYMLFEFIKGQHHDHLSHKQRQQVIEVAAQLQTITSRYRPALKAYRWNYDAQLCLALAHAEAEKIGTTNAFAKHDWFKQAIKDLNLPGQHPKAICHADYDPSNLLFNGDTLLALIDFDDANYTYSTFDLVHLIDSWAWPFQGQFSADTARDIIYQYDLHRSLSPIEKQHLFDVHKLQIFIDGIWFFARGEASNFYERQKIAFLNGLGREGYYHLLFE